jgi:hypothetical protein
VRAQGMARPPDARRDQRANSFRRRRDRAAGAVKTCDFALDALPQTRRPGSYHVSQQAVCSQPAGLKNWFGAKKAGNGEFLIKVCRLSNEALGTLFCPTSLGKHLAGKEDRRSEGAVAQSTRVSGRLGWEGVKLGQAMELTGVRP